MTLFLAYSGMRPGEVFALEWSDLDFDRMRIRVERRVYKGSLDVPKANRPRLIMVAAAEPVLRRTYSRDA